MNFEEDININSDLPSQSEIPAEIPSLVQNSMPTTITPTSQLVWNLSNGSVYGPAKVTNIPFDTNFYPEYAAKTYNDRWQSNFGYILAPSNPAFVDATLTDEDIANGLHLENNPNGIKWRVDAAGTPPYEDFKSYLEQNRIIEATNNRTFAEETTGDEVRKLAGLTNPQRLSRLQSEKSSLSYKSGYYAGINNKSNQITPELRSVIEKMDHVNLKNINDIIKGLSSDGIIVITTKPEQDLSVIYIKDLEKQYNVILNTSDAFERGRLEAELSIDVLSVLRSDEFARLLAMKVNPSTDFYQKHAGLLMQPWLSNGHNILINKIKDVEITDILRKSGWNITDKDIEKIKQASEEADVNYPGNNALHAMPEVGSLSIIKVEFEKNMQHAISLERLGLHEEAMRYLGFAMHTAQDLYSHWSRGNDGTWGAHFKIDVVDGVAIPRPDNPNNNPDIFRNAGDATKVVALIFANGKNTGVINDEMTRWIFGQ